MEEVMKKLVAMFTRSNVNLNTTVERRRLEKAMPGEIGSMNSLRLTGVSL
jgi:hypothetical protein